MNNNRLKHCLSYYFYIVLAVVNFFAMKILKAGTKVTTVIGEVQAIITGVYITMDTLEYKIRWFYNGEEKTAWVFRHEIEVSRPKQTAGFNSVNTQIIEDNEITLISTP